ncbi:MAG: hypothetical protein M3464_12715 [Chloroflexota bacterium]|nr:hypothetical protein [Chloroflexota bacterium]
MGRGSPDTNLWLTLERRWPELICRAFERFAITGLGDVAFAGGHATGLARGDWLEDDAFALNAAHPSASLAGPAGQIAFELGLRLLVLLVVPSRRLDALGALFLILDLPALRQRVVRPGILGAQPAEDSKGAAGR